MIAWVLNFDADDELARPAGYTPSRAVLARFEGLRARVAGLVGEGDRVLEADGDRADGFFGRAFSPTPRALRRLVCAGAIAPPAPSLDVLRAVSHRAFAASLGQPLELAAFARSREEVALAIARAPDAPWVLKRAFGFAGRGKLRVAGARELDASAAWIDRALGEGGVQCEPVEARELDVALHGFLDRRGALTLGAPTVQRIDERGAWIATERAAPGKLERAEEAALFAEAERSASALHLAGYFGPFGVDAFRFRARSGALAFHPRCDLNPRYTMGWAIGMGARRPDRLV